MNEVVKQADIKNQLRFIESLEGDNYQFHVRAFTRWAADRQQLDRQCIIDYFEYLNKSAYSAGTKRIKRQAIKARLRQLNRVGGLDYSLQANLETFLRDLDRQTKTKAPKVNTHAVERERYLSKAEVIDLLEHSRGTRQNLIVKFLWASGCRISEMIGIRKTDVKYTDDIVHIRITGKGNKERWIKISTGLYNEIDTVFRGVQYLFETSTGRQYVRTAVSDQLAKMTKRVLGRKCRAHTFRHSFATHKIREGVQLSYISKYLGHSSLSITADMYDHGSIDNADLIGDEV